MNTAIQNRRVFLKTILLTPIVPIVFLIYYLCINLCDIKIVSLFITFIFAFVLYEFIHYFKNKFESLFHISIVCADWFLIDLVNILTSGKYDFLKPSVLETIARSSISIII